MLYYALVFLVVGLIAGVLGVSGVAAVATNIAYVLFVIAIVLFLIHLLSGRRLPGDAGLFVAMRRSVVERLLASPDPDPYLVGLIGRTGLPLASIPVERRATQARPSAYTGSMRLRLAWRAVVTIVRPTHEAGAGRAARPPARVREYIGARFRPADLLTGREGTG